MSSCRGVVKPSCSPIHTLRNSPSRVAPWRRNNAASVSTSGVEQDRRMSSFCVVCSKGASDALTRPDGELWYASRQVRIVEVDGIACGCSEPPLPASGWTHERGRHVQRGVTADQRGQYDARRNLATRARQHDAEHRFDGHTRRDRAKSRMCSRLSRWSNRSTCCSSSASCSRYSSERSSMLVTTPSGCRQRPVLGQ